MDIIPLIPDVVVAVAVGGVVGVEVAVVEEVVEVEVAAVEMGKWFFKSTKVLFFAHFSKRLSIGRCLLLLKLKLQTSTFFL